MKTSEELDEEAAERLNASNTNRLELVKDLARPAKTAVRAWHAHGICDTNSDIIQPL